MVVDMRTIEMKTVAAIITNVAVLEVVTVDRAAEDEVVVVVVVEAAVVVVAVHTWIDKKALALNTMCIIFNK